MKASEFIQVALIDQMQQIADLGLWFHVAKLLPPGVELLGIVVYGHEVDDTIAKDSDYLDRLAGAIYGDFFPTEYPFYPTKTTFFSISPKIFLTSNESDKCRHLTTDENGVKFIHVPQWFSDFKAACRMVLEEIDNRTIEDIEVLKTLE